MYATISSAGIYLISFYPFEQNGGSFWLEGNFSYFGVVIVANIKVLVDTSSHTFWSCMLPILSIVVFFLTYAAESLIPYFPVFGSVEQLLNSREFYLGMILMLIALIMIEIGLNYVNHKLRKRWLRLANRIREGFGSVFRPSQEVKKKPRLMTSS